MRQRKDENARAPKEPPTPGTITAIEAQQRDNARVNVYLDGSFAFGLHADLVLDHRLRLGEELSESRIATLLAADEEKKAVTAAINLIAFRPRAGGELQQSLRTRGFSPEASARAVERVQELGYQDDARFAERWVENRQEHRPRGARLLQQELRQKGIDADIVRDVLGRVAIDENEDALKLASKKAESMRALDQPTRHRRISGFLGRRGYGFDVIRRVLESID